MRMVEEYVRPEERVRIHCATDRRECCEIEVRRDGVRLLRKRCTARKIMLFGIALNCCSSLSAQRMA